MQNFKWHHLLLILSLPFGVEAKEFYSSQFYGSDYYSSDCHHRHSRGCHHHHHHHHDSYIDPDYFDPDYDGWSSLSDAYLEDDRIDEGILVDDPVAEGLPADLEADHNNLHNLSSAYTIFQPHPKLWLHKANCAYKHHKYEKCLKYVCKYKKALLATWPYPGHISCKQHQIIRYYKTHCKKRLHESYSDSSDSCLDCSHYHFSSPPSSDYTSPSCYHHHSYDDSDISDYFNSSDNDFLHNSL
jgi:hypothetical protein